MPYYPVTWPYQRLVTAPFQGAVGQSYLEKVLSTSPFAYWPLNETSGTNADNAEGTASLDGTYSGPTLGQNQPPFIAPSFDGINDLVQLPSANLDGVFDPALGSAMAWVKVPDDSVWTDSTFRSVFAVGVDGSNRILLYKLSTDRFLRFLYTAGGTTDVIDFSSASGTDWVHLLITWDKDGADQTEFFVNNTSIGTSPTLGVWAGVLTDSNTKIGEAASSLWSGNIAHAAIWDKVLSADERAIVSTLP